MLALHVHVKISPPRSVRDAQVQQLGEKPAATRLNKQATHSAACNVASKVSVAVSAEPSADCIVDSSESRWVLQGTAVSHACSTACFGAFTQLRLDLPPIGFEPTQR